jgi:hypothetical protein
MQVKHMVYGGGKKVVESIYCLDSGTWCDWFEEEIKLSVLEGLLMVVKDGKRMYAAECSMGLLGEEKGHG